MKNKWWVVPGLIAMLCGCSPGSDRSSATGHKYVSEERCVQCHAAQAKAWAGSHHDLAMQEATQQTVLGDFTNTRFSYAGTTSRFFRRDGKFFVHTGGLLGRRYRNLQR